MKSETILSCIGDIDLKLIEEAERKVKSTKQNMKKSTIPVLRFAPIVVASILLLVIINTWNKLPVPTPNLPGNQPIVDASTTHSVQEPTNTPPVASAQEENVSQTPTEPQRIISALVAGQHEAKVTLIDGELNFILDVSVISGAPPPVDPQTTYNEKWGLNQVIDYLGVDFRPEYIPAGLCEPEGEQVWTVIFNNDGSRMPHSFTFGFRYRESFGDEYDPLRRSLEVKTAKGERPFQCALHHTETETLSNINGVDIIVGYTKLSYGPYIGEEKTPSGYYDIYLAEFMYGGNGYYIRGENLSQEEFVSVLLSIIKL